MGNDVHVKKEQRIRQKNIKAEWKKSKNNRILLFLGDAKCGKTTIINTVMSRFSKIKTSQMQQSEYGLQSFTVSEISLIGTNNSHIPWGQGSSL